MYLTHSLWGGVKGSVHPNQTKQNISSFSLVVSLSMYIMCDGSELTLSWYFAGEIHLHFWFDHKVLGADVKAKINTCASLEGLESVSSWTFLCTTSLFRVSTGHQHHSTSPFHIIFTSCIRVVCPHNLFFNLHIKHLMVRIKCPFQCPLVLTTWQLNYCFSRFVHLLFFHNSVMVALAQMSRRCYSQVFIFGDS